jgi:ornithine cyclodeaminase/alanine dehydrogenase-like protein (mu-crystallin family)
MPSLCEDEGNLGVKLVTFYPHNMERHGVQTHNAVIILFETRTGVPKAVG